MKFDQEVFGTAAELSDDVETGDQVELRAEKPAINMPAGNIGPKRFRLISFEELRPGNDPTYLVKGLVPLPGVTLIWGPPKCGKSFWTFDMLMHVALGIPYRGRRVRQGNVVYLALEGGSGFRRRAEAFRRRFNRLAAPFYLIDQALDLVAYREKLAGAIRQQLDAAPEVVVIDTLNRSLDGSESSDEDMASYIRAADMLRDEFACAVIIVHHCGHDDKRPRGHSSLLGAVDAQIAVRKDADSVIVCEVERMKDGLEGAKIISRLEQVELGVDEDGDPITSCVVVEAEASEAPADKRANLSDSVKLALRALDEALVDLGKQEPGMEHIPAGTIVVKLETWRDYAYKLGVSASDEPRARQQAFKRAIEKLLTLGAIAKWGDYVWKLP